MTFFLIFLFFFEQKDQSSLKQDSNQVDEKNRDANGSVSNCAGPLVDLTGHDELCEGGANYSIEENSAIKRRNVEIASVSDCSDVADSILNSDFQSTSSSAAKSSFKEVL